MTTTLEALQIACPDMRPIAFEDIRKGDVLVRDFCDGDFVVRKACQLDGSFWRNERHNIAARSDIADRYYLLYRPKPELPTEVGAMVRVKELPNVWAIFVKKDGLWLSLKNELHYEDSFFDTLKWERVYLTTKEPDDE